MGNPPAGMESTRPVSGDVASRFGPRNSGQSAACDTRANALRRKQRGRSIVEVVGGKGGRSQQRNSPLRQETRVLLGEAMTSHISRRSALKSLAGTAAALSAAAQLEAFAQDAK